VLNLCRPLNVPSCPSPPQRQVAAVRVSGALSSAEIAGLVAQSTAGNGETRALPSIDLLSATAGGAPNVVSLAVAGLDPQIAKELDDSYVAMNLRLAQRLVYGRQSPKVTGIVLQLHHTRTLKAARARLNGLIAEHNLPLEVRDFAELNPFYVQVRQFFSALFLFIALIMGVIVLFAVANTMTMAVMERTAEIGTVRAMGVRRSGIRRQFLIEGALLGAIGATLGAVGAYVVALTLGNGALHWTPPGNSAPVPLLLTLQGHWILIAGVWIALAAVATLAARAPAARAAKLEVVEALRHA
jgi:putative ABC transport system permease protein